MKSKFILMLAVAFTLQVQSIRASVQNEQQDTVRIHEELYSEEMLKCLEPTYEDGILAASPWNGNWFVNLSGGASAFMGKPLGCEDLFGRMKPTLSISLGKWFTPSVGGRLKYQGWQFINSEIGTNDFQYLHADFLWNILGYRYGKQEDVRWGIIPFAGVGLIHNKGNGKKPFTISYGIQGQYRFSKRVAVTMELSNAMTFEDFDGYGRNGKFGGDNLLTLSAGLSITIGKAGWKRVVNPQPYIRQNEWLVDYANSLTEANRGYKSLHDKDSRTIAELRKILEIEGLLEDYAHLFDESDEYIRTSYPKNNYSGLNSLRARLKNKQWDGKSPLVPKTRIGNNEKTEMADSISSGDFLALMQDGKICIGSPIYFFFRLGTSNLTNSSQLVNLDALAKVVKQYGLAVKVAGAADSATGTTDINDRLSCSRAEYISKELQRRGISKEAISEVHDGGIDEYAPDEANRHTRVTLHFK